MAWARFDYGRSPTMLSFTISLFVFRLEVVNVPRLF